MNNTMIYRFPEGVTLRATDSATLEEVLTPQAVEFVAQLEREFRTRRQALLTLRGERQALIDAGKMPEFLPDTRQIRQTPWRVAPVPHDLLDRRVEITGPPDRKMIIHALNSGANVYMADFEDATSPTWMNLIRGQQNVRDAVDRTIRYTAPDGRISSLNDQTATLMVRPRGWHLHEKHLLVDGSPVSASLFDFGLFFFHNARKLLDKGSGPYFYLPKLENHLEARLWNDVFVLAQELLGIPRGTIRATVLIETILAAFEMQEILYELREHSAGLNCGRWDYIFSVIKKFHRFPEFVLPDRASLTMTTHFLRSYSLLLIQICHQHGAHAIGGMAAQIPVKNNPEANERAFALVQADKEREATDGHDGTWVAHPRLVPLAKSVFDRQMPGPNQLHRTCDDVHITAADLLTIPQGEITEEGFRTNIRVALQYIASWLQGQGCVPLHHLMEDAATAEISRAQLWQWVHHPDSHLIDGWPMTEDGYRKLEQEEFDRLEGWKSREPAAAETLQIAARLLNRLVTEQRFTEFFTTEAYHYLE